MSKKITLTLMALMFFVPSFALAVDQPAESTGAQTSEQNQTQTKDQADLDQLKLRIKETKEANEAKRELKRKEVLTQVQKTASNRLDKIILRYGKIKTRVNQLPNLSESAKQDLNGKIDAEIAKMNSAKAQVAQATTVEQVKTVMNQVRASVKTSIENIKNLIKTARNTRATNAVARLSKVNERLIKKIAELKDAGKNVTEIEKIEALYNTNIEAAKAKINSGDAVGAKESIEKARQNLVELVKQIKALKGAA